jgi:glutamate-1-semialdehyde aminotransferase
MTVTTESGRLLERARRIIPGASQTVSKGPTQWVQGVAPNFVVRGEGARVQDVDGRWYLDLPAALGPIVLGYGHEAVNEAIARQLQDGITFTLPHPLEVEVAERIHAAVPSADRVRFAKTGSDVVSAAVRLARAWTGRDRVVVAGYHGWHDWYVGATSRGLGVPQAVRDLVTAVTIDGTDAWQSALGDDVACVVLEPIGLAEPAPGALAAVVEAAHAAGALAVFDEVISGFRLGMGGAQEHYGATADLAAYGKALGNGMPISAVAGRADVMDLLEDVFVSGTHGGEALSLAAARATLDVMADQPVHDHLWRLGARLQEGVRNQAQALGVADWITVGGAAPWTLVVVREPHPEAEGLPAKTLLQQEMLRQGVLYNGSNFISWAHDEAAIDEAIEAYGRAFAVLADALPDGVDARLDGPPLAAVFRPTT